MKNKIILMLFTILSINSLAQTVKKNQQKYWDYRDRLKKWYMKVGSENGESQIMDTRGLSRNNSIDTTIYGNVFPRNTHWLNWGDNTTIQLGYYISTLSMEYKLLKKNGKDTKATLNEIYYALYTLNRLDDYSDKYLIFDTLQFNRDGILLRTDVESKTAKDWFDEDGTFIVDSKSFHTYNERYVHVPNMQNKVRENKEYYDSIAFDSSNIMSADEVMGITLGVVSLIKFVDDIYVRPDNALEGYYIVSEGKNILKRILNKVSATKYTDTCILGVKSFYNWAFENPSPFAGESDDQLIGLYAMKVPTGGSFWFSPATMLDKISIKYLDTTYNDSIAAQNCQIALSMSTVAFITSIINPVNGILELLLDEGISSIKSDLSSITTNTILNRPKSSISNKVRKQWDEIQITLDSFYNTGLITETSKIDDKANNVYVYNIVLGILGNIIDSTNILYYSELIGGRELFLLNAVFNQTALGAWPKSFYDTLLNAAPSNFNPGTEYLNVEPWSNYNCNYWGPPNLWHTASHERATGGHFIVGQRNGLDYMFLYNLYHLYFDSNTTYQESACDCYKYPFDTLADTLQGTKTLKRIHPDYRSKNIAEPKFINTNLTILPNSKLITYADLYICHRLGQSSTNVTCHGIMDIGHTSDTMKMADLVIKSGNSLTINDIDGAEVIIRKRGKLIMESESQIIIGNNGQLVLQTGSTLINNGGMITIQNGGQLIVDSSALSYIINNGSLILDSGATLIVNGNGIMSIDSNGGMVYNKNPNIYLNGPNAELKLFSTLTLRGSQVKFHYYKNNYSQVAGFIHLNNHTVFDVEDSKASIILIGEDTSDVLVKISNTCIIPDSLISPSHYIDSLVLFNGKIVNGGIETNCKIASQFNVFYNHQLKTQGRPIYFYHDKFINSSYTSVSNNPSTNGLQYFHYCKWENSPVQLTGSKVKLYQCDLYNSPITCTYMDKLYLWHTSLTKTSTNAALSINDNTQSLMATKHANYFMDGVNFIGNDLALNIPKSGSYTGASVNMKCCLFKDNSLAIDGYEACNINMSRTYECDSQSAGDNVFWNNLMDTVNNIYYTLNVGDVYLRNGHNAFIYEYEYNHLPKLGFFRSKISQAYRSNIVYCNQSTGTIRIDSNFWYPGLGSGVNPNPNIKYLTCDWNLISSFPNPTYSTFTTTGLLLDTINNSCLTGITVQSFKIKTDGTLQKYWGSIKLDGLYPNPNDGNFTANVKLDGINSASGQYYITDLNGNILYISSTMGFSEGNNAVNFYLSWLSPGVYFIKFVLNNGDIAYAIFIKV